MTSKKALASGILIVGLFGAVLASAHVTVKPASVGIGLRQVFTVSVPTEKNIPTIGLRLLVPAGIKSVTPNVKPGWKIEVKTQATGKKITDEDGMEVDEMLPSEIIWTGGSIPAGQRDEFYFQTQVPASAATLAWKAYQTYQDGSVVAWDQTPSSTAKSPYSITQIVDDLSNTPNVSKPSWWEVNQVNISLGISLFALVTSLVILVKHNKK